MSETTFNANRKCKQDRGWGRGGLTYFSRTKFSIREGGTKWANVHVCWWPRSEWYFYFALWIPWRQDFFRAYKDSNGHGGLGIGA